MEVARQVGDSEVAEVECRQWYACAVNAQRAPLLDAGGGRRKGGGRRGVWVGVEDLSVCEKEEGGYVNAPVGEKRDTTW